MLQRRSYRGEPSYCHMLTKVQKKKMIPQSFVSTVIKSQQHLQQADQSQNRCGGKKEKSEEEIKDKKRMNKYRKAKIIKSKQGIKKQSKK